ncbi:uncharacterized protein LOC102790544 [Neolamprologus brichardi]|uniref:uncharacterized protein LOC102790544 n=1 Tax=Neolamprologus brichardi TaxID=32507 RepID=UPI001643EA5B|nr:uncharacterized protein LOC102790544 [Neolamprologus brichardi]
MQKTDRKKRVPRTSRNLTKSAPHLAVRTDSNSRLTPVLNLEPIADTTRGTHFIFGPTAGLAGVIALRLAQVETEAQIALRQLAALATITFGSQCHSNWFTAALPPHLALLTLFNRPQAVGYSSYKTYRTTRPCPSAAMYHQHPQGSQPFSNGGRPPPRQPPPNQHQTRSNMQVMGFQFPRPTQLPDELESALAIRGARDMDHRQIDHMTQPDPHQNQGSGTSQHGNFGSNPVSLPTDSQSEHHQRVDWSSYQPPAKLFAAPPPSSSHQSQQAAQQPQNTQAGSRLSIWTPSVCESLSNQVRHVHGASGEGPSLYTPESAGSILASFGLSNEDLEVLSHYPDDQLTPDTLPFILRDIQINKSGKQKTKLPTPTMISDFSAVSPKVYPHTCSLCHIVCDQEKVSALVNAHLTVSNSLPKRVPLSNKLYFLSVSSRSGRYGSRALWDPKDGSPSRSMSQSLSRSRSPSPPSKKRRVDSHPFRPQKRRNSPQRYPQQMHDTEHRDRLKYRHSGSHSPSNMNRTFREYWSARRDRVSTGSFSRVAVKRPRRDSTKHPTDTSRDRASHLGGHGSKHGSSQPSTKSLKALNKHGPKTAKMSAKPPPAKKKKKTVTPASQDSQSVANRLVYLTGIPEDASEQEVTDLVGAFGKINNVILMPRSEESEKGQGQKASVCMVKAEDAQALATSTNLSIREQHITASVAKMTAEGNADQKTSNEKGRLLITGLPESGWSECDIINLIQPFDTPSDIILATQMGKALVSVPHMDVVQEMVKVHTFVPAKVKDCEVKLTPLKQHISFNTPSRAPVSWNSLLVIGNVPDTPSGSSEVEKLVRRFGTVIKTLVLSSMVICEMATAAMALSVYKRFQAFPCIIQNNPLFFSRKPDPKASTQTKAIAAPHDASEDPPANGQAKQTSADREEAAHSSGSPEERIDKHGDGDANKMTGREETAEEVLEACKDGNVEKDELTVCDSAPENQLEADTTGTSGIDVKTTEESKVSASEAEQTPADEESQPPRLDGEAGSEEAAELPKVTQAMVNALLVECRTGPTGSSRAAPPSGEKGEHQTETKLGQKATETKEMTKKQMGVEGEVKRQEKERKEARKEKEVRERMKRQRERDRRGWEKEERAKREWAEKSRRERREEERREWERKERERRERKRAHGNGLSGSRLSSRDTEKVILMWFGVLLLVPVSFVHELDLSDAAIDVTAAPAKPELTPEGDVTANLLPSAAVSPPPAHSPVHNPSEADVTPQPDSSLTAEFAPEDQSVPVPAAAAASSSAAERGQDGDEENLLEPRETVEEEKMGLVNQEEHLKVQDQENKDRRETAAETGKQEQSEQNPSAEEESEKFETEHSLPPFDPSNPVGLEFLVPKTGFFCKVCARFFSGSKEAEISHCKTRKHYETLQKYLKTSKTTSETAKPDSS